MSELRNTIIELLKTHSVSEKVGDRRYLVTAEQLADNILLYVPQPSSKANDEQVGCAQEDNSILNDLLLIQLEDAEKEIEALKQQLSAQVESALPKEPPTGLLVSMAIRYDHALAIPGYYDQEFLAQSGLTHQQRFDSVISRMRQLYEEVSGYGFYSPKKETEYASLMPLPASPTSDEKL